MTDLTAIPTLEHSQPTPTMPTRACADSVLGHIVAAFELAHHITNKCDAEIPLTT